MSAQQSVSVLIDLLQAGDDSLAQNELWHRYYESLANRVSLRLSRRFCGVADEEDIALSAMNSLFRGLKAGHFPDLESRTSLWNLLLTIAYRKAIKHHKKEHSAKRGGGNVHNFTSLSPTDSAASSQPFEVADAEPTEEEIEVAIEEMTEDLDDPTLRVIAVRRLQGYTDKEIAQQLGVAERTVIRKRQRIQAIWQTALTE